MQKVVYLIDLTTKVGTLKLHNPTILASGIMDEDAGSMNRILSSGAAGVVTKSIGLTSKKGHPNPTFLELEHGILNAMGLPNPGIKEYGSEIAQVDKGKGVVIGSIFGGSSDDFQTLAKQMESFGVDAVELNLSCPHAKGYGLEVGQDPDLIKEISYDVKKSIKIPVFVKLSPNVNDIVVLATAAEEGGADGIVAINTVKAMSIDIEFKKPVLANKIGGYSGKAIKPIGLRNVFDIYQHVKIPIIGVGGITKGYDVLEYIMAGATAVQIGSGVYYRGIEVFNDVIIEIIDWMKKHDYHSIHELIGAAHQ